MSSIELPFIISFVIDSNGRLLDGTLLADAIDKIDDLTADQAIGYGVNYIHPSTLFEALSKNRQINNRIVLFSGNTSTRRADELDDLDELDTQDPQRFASAVKELIEFQPIPIIGGCCGTDVSHIKAIAEIQQKRIGP